MVYIYATSSPFYWHGLTLIPAWICNHIHYKLWDEIAYPFLNFYGSTVKIKKWMSNFTHTLLGMWLIIHAGIKVKPCQ